MTVMLKSLATAPSFSERLLGLFFDYPALQIPQSARNAVLLCFEDTIGVALAASALGVGTAGATIALEDCGSAEATVWGTGAGARRADACLANGMLAHALDFDDTHPAAIMHASAVNVPVALAVGEATRASASEVLAAAILGYEISARLGRLGPGPFQDRGFQSTAVLGIFAATFIAARLMKVGPRVAAQAMGVAGSMASGLMAYLADATDVKQMHPGWSAHSGIRAVQLARAGLTGPATVLEGRFGVFRSFANLDINPESVLSFSGARFEVEEMAPKPYPACLCVHPLVQATLELRARGILSPGSINAMEEIHCEVPQWYVNLVFEPLEQKTVARNAYEGRFSAPYCIARAVLDGKLDVQSFSPESLADQKVIEISRKVTYQARNFQEFPETFPALVRVRLRDGSTHEAFVPHNLGSAKNPLGAAGIASKYRANAEFAIGVNAADRLQAAIRGLEGDTSIETFWALLRSTVSQDRKGGPKSALA
jgi:2-methylcitrate dehydratase PrpD